MLFTNKNKLDLCMTIECDEENKEQERNKVRGGMEREEKSTPSEDKIKENSIG